MIETALLITRVNGIVAMAGLGPPYDVRPAAGRAIMPA
jgi:hypothetical protein